ncbi:MAG TPA: cell division protein FtsX [Xylella sp.]
MNKPFVGSIHSCLAVCVGHHMRSITFSSRCVMRRPLATLLTVMALTLALALPLGLSIMLNNLRSLADSVQQSRQINLFLKVDVDAVAAEHLATELRRRSDVAAVILRTPAQGLAELREGAKLDEALDALGENPLPSLLIITPSASAVDGDVVRVLQALPEADLVQYDVLWQRRLGAWLGFGQYIVNILSALFSFVAFMVVCNTVRLDIQSRRQEIAVLHLLGASDGFIRRPYLYLGAWYCAVAGLAAFGVLFLIWLALRAPLMYLTDSYSSQFVFHGLNISQSALILGGIILSGWLSVWFATAHYLRQMRPA